MYIQLLGTSSPLGPPTANRTERTRGARVPSGEEAWIAYSSECSAYSLLSLCAGRNVNKFLVGLRDHGHHVGGLKYSSYRYIWLR